MTKHRPRSRRKKGESDRMNVKDIAAFFGIHPKTVYNTLAVAPERLPPRISLPHSKRYLWHRPTVEAWNSEQAEVRGTLVVEEVSGRFVPAIIINGKRSEGRPRAHLNLAVEDVKQMYTEARLTRPLVEASA